MLVVAMCVPRTASIAAVDDAKAAVPSVSHSTVGPFFGDFNGDGYADLAVGAPRADVNGVADAGEVEVFWGTKDGLSTSGHLVITEATLGLPVSPDHFGSSLVSGNLNKPFIKNDPYDSLAIGASAYVDQGVANAGAIFVLWGSPSGLGSSYQLLTQSDAGISPQSDAGFGFSMGASNLMGDGASDLAVGMPGFTVGGATDAGEALIYEGHIGGTLTLAQTLTEASIGGLSQPGDAFGYAMHCGHLNGTAALAGYRALAIGIPFKNVDGQEHAGEVVILYGGTRGFPVHKGQFWSEDSPGIAGVARPDDNFGFAVGSGYITEPYRDLVVGIPGKASGAGAINVMYGSAKGITSAGDQYLSMDSPGVPHNARPGDQFGYSLSSRDMGWGRGSDVAIGVPGADGAIVLYATPTGLGTGHAVWIGDTQDGTFGLDVSALDLSGGAYASLVVATPFKTVEGLINAGGFLVAYSIGPGGFGPEVSYVSEDPQAGAELGGSL